MKINRLKKSIGAFTIVLLAMITMSGCADEGKIYPVSREEGSGTRSAFVELSGTESESGRDLITQKAEITNSTAVMLQTIAGNKNAIGYVSLGSMVGTVKGIEIDGVAGTPDNIENGSYKIARTFNLVLGKKVDSLSQDFIKFIKSQEGQNIVEQQGYIKENGAGKYKMLDNSLKGKITIAGSTSVAPVIEVIGAKYMEMYPNVKIEIQQSGSSAGITAVSQGVCQIGLSSRELQDDEKALGLSSLSIAKDGIVIIACPENPIKGLSSEQVREIFSGQLEYWDEILEKE